MKTQKELLEEKETQGKDDIHRGRKILKKGKYSKNYFESHLNIS